jgi:hypothetical protein
MIWGIVGLGTVAAVGWGLAVILKAEVVACQESGEAARDQIDRLVGELAEARMAMRNTVPTIDTLHQLRRVARDLGEVLRRLESEFPARIDPAATEPQAATDAMGPL